MRPHHSFSISLFCSIAICGSLLAANYAVSPGGSDSASGSLSNPWATFSHATSQLTAGDTLNIRAGVYQERLILNGKNATKTNPIIVAAYREEEVVIDGSALSVPSGGRAGLVVINNCNHVHVLDITVQNYKTSAANRIPVGIQIEGSGTGVQVSGCTVHAIHQNSTSSDANGFGISIYGTSSTSLDQVHLSNNEIHDLRTGQSESIALNGNVTNFIVRKNTVHNCNNIGIDFIGYEGSAPAGVDRARNGLCSENVVHHIDSAFNPGYGGSFSSGGGDESAAGIYVDGGQDIVIERNRVYQCNFGIELASEDQNGFTEGITMRNNLLHHNYGPGLIMGGYDSQRGQTRLCKICNNTLYKNDTRKTYGGQIALQFHLYNNQFQNNLVWANSQTGQMIIHYVEGGTAAQRSFSDTNIFDYNFYFWNGNASDIEFGLNLTGNANNSYYGLTAWQSAVGSGTHSKFQNPGFLIPVPSTTPEPGDFALSTNSLSIDAGAPPPGFLPAEGERDFAGQSRVANQRIDVGCHEHLTALQKWRDSYFETPDNAGDAANLFDPDKDGISNYLEYSQGMNPLLPDRGNAPGLAFDGAGFRYQFRKEASELTYTVQQSSDLRNWLPVSSPESNDGQGLYWHPLIVSDNSLFLRLKVSDQ